MTTRRNLATWQRILGGYGVIGGILFAASIIALSTMNLMIWYGHGDTGAWALAASLALIPGLIGIFMFMSALILSSGGADE